MSIPGGRGGPTHLTRPTKTPHGDMRPEQLSLKVWGNLACFTRPENKVERVSYDVMTASAARGILESVYWKPEFQWQVDEIHVLKPIRYVSIKRNEVNTILNADGIERVYRDNQKNRLRSYDAPRVEVDDSAVRTQRQTLFLKDVAYIIKAHVDVVRGEDPAAKHVNIFRNRIKKGACVKQPFFGTRECMAHFDVPDGSEVPIPDSQDLGFMLHDFYYTNTGQAIPMFLPMKMKRGIIRFPERPFDRSMYPEVKI